jgi:DNA-binding GntR family transcriptional regulator
MPVREAFRRLTSEGALEPLSNGKTRVPVLDTARLQELTEIRMAVEGLAARRAAEHVSPQELSAISRANAEMLEAVARRDVAAEAKANEQFHFAIYRAAKSSELLRIIEHLWLRAGPFMKTFLDDYYRSASTRKYRTTRHHEELLAALKERDADGAEQALRQDLAQGAAFIALRAEQRASAPQPRGTRRNARAAKPRRAKRA